MRHDTIEIVFPGKSVRRRDAHLLTRPRTASDEREAAVEAPASDARDEAFAGLSRDERRPKDLFVVTQLAEQLEALDRQRGQLARLLRDIEATKLAD